MTVSVDAGSILHLKSDILNAETTFLSAQGDSNALTSFSKSWDNLNTRIGIAADSFALDEETGLAAQSVANNIAILAESLLSLHLAEDQILLDHMSEVDEILREGSESSRTTSIARHARAASLHRNDFTYTSIDQMRQHFDDGSASDSTTSSPFVKEASRWLLKHLQNPYPSQKAKLRMVRGSNATIKSVTDWFTHARRRIGWIKICKQHFQGNRHLTADCAQGIFREGATPSTCTSEIAQEFWAMKTAAERLYGEKAVGELVKNIGVVENDNRKRPGENRPSCNKEQQGYKRKRDSCASDDGTGSGFDSNSSWPHVRRTSDAYSFEKEYFAKRRRPDDEGEREWEGKTGMEEHLGALSSESVARSASFTFSASSRDSTEELSTPSASVTDLPSYIPSNTIDEWLSSIALQQPSCNPESISNESRKRCISESRMTPPLKRHRQNSSNTSTSELSTDSHLPSQQTRDVPFEILPQFNFTLPPPATISNIEEGEALHLKFFDCSYWQGTDIARSPLEAYDEVQGGDACSNSGGIHEWIDGILNSLSPNLPEPQAVTEQDEAPNDVGSPSEDSRFYNNSEPKQDASDSFVESGGQLSLPVGALFENFCPAQQSDLDEQHGWIDSNSLQNENLAKLERLNLLLAEAAKLQQEVFG